MPDRASSARVVLRLAGALLLAAAAAGVWELLASQAPGTPLYLGILPAPVERLRHDSFDFGVLLAIAGLVLGEREVPRRVLLWLGLGSVLMLLAGLYAAATGMPGVQIIDLRADAPWLFGAKVLGRALLIAGLINIGWAALVKRPP
jgi:hypothetical protein